MKQENFKVLFLSGLIPVIWLALLIAPSFNGGLPQIIMDFSDVMENPFNIVLCKDSFKVVLIVIFVYFICLCVYYSTRKNYRKQVEHGSAKWGDINKISSKYKQEPLESNKILSKHFLLGYDSHVHRRNLNTVVIGGSGAGKTRFYAKPNLLQANTSFVVLDPKGELTRAEAGMLEKKGYVVKVIDLINMENSLCYNPFHYLKNDNDVQILVTNLFKSTTPKDSSTQDPFWDLSASMLLKALIFYLWYEAPEEEQNFAMIMEMLRCTDVKEEDEGYVNPLDILFNQLEVENPYHVALKYYRQYRNGPAKTIKSINLSLITRLDKFNLKSLESLTQTDELELDKMGERKTALFAIIPDSDSSFNFLISILYTQIFQQMFYKADFVYKKELPVPVHFLMDEFANVSLPDDFPKILSVMRSRGVSVSIILQNLSQLQSLFEKDWKSIMGNCDEFVFLGGNEQETHKYVSESLGKETIDTNSYGLTHGERGNFSTNYQIMGRELLTPDEVRMLDTDDAIIFMRGEYPVKDVKYDIKDHPNVKLSEDGGAKPYIHGSLRNNVATINVDLDSAVISKKANDRKTNINIEDYDIVPSYEMDKYLKKEGKGKNEKESD